MIRAKDNRMKNTDPIYITLTDTNFRKEVLESTRPFLVEFGADWCGTCRINAPIIKKAFAGYKGRIKFGKIDLEQNERVFKEYGIRDIPTILLFKNGQVVDHITGCVKREDLTAKLEYLSGEDQLKK